MSVALQAEQSLECTYRYAIFNQQTSDGGRLDALYVGTTTSLLPSPAATSDYNRLRLEYDYDSFGNVKTLREGFNGTGPTTHGFSYDAYNRLTGAFGQGYTYDNAGRVTGFEGVSHGFDSVKKHAIDTVGGVDRYDYDANGNMKVRNKGLSSQQTLGWDVENRLLSVAASGLAESYAYNENGIRVKKVSNGVTTLYPFAHYEVENGGVVKYYFFAGQRVAMRRGSTLTYLHPDHLGSTAQATDSSGGIVANQGYHGYGKYRLGGALPTEHRYTGQKLDATGLMYYGARYYDRHIGTFISPDTLVPDPTNVWDYNRFAYARLNPLKYNDPTGHEPKQPCCITGGPSLAPKVLQLIVDLAEVVWDGTSSERSTAGEVLDGALHHPLFGPSVDEISAVHEHLVETYVDPHLPKRVVSARDTIDEVLKTAGVGDILLATIRVPPLGQGGAAADDLVRIVERDGDIVEIVAKGKNGDITAIARMHKEGDQLILSGLHIDGPGPGGSSIEELMNIGRTLGRQEGANEVVVYGARRTTGANPGRVPRPIRIKVE